MFKEFLKKERQIWHKRFTPSLIAGIAVALITLFFKMTASNIVLFSSLGASAAIITQKYVHKLTILRTVIQSYLVSLIVSFFVIFLIGYFKLSFTWSVLIVVTLVTLGVYLLDAFHPPAISAAISFILIDGGVWDTLLIFFAVILLLVLVKLLTYIFYYQHLKLKDFHKEFKKFEHEEVKEFKKKFS